MRYTNRAVERWAARSRQNGNWAASDFKVRLSLVGRRAMAAPLGACPSTLAETIASLLLAKSPFLFLLHATIVFQRASRNSAQREIAAYASSSTMSRAAVQSAKAGGCGKLAFKRTGPEFFAAGVSAIAAVLSKAAGTRISGSPDCSGRTTNPN